MNSHSTDRIPGSSRPVVIIEPNYMGHRMVYCRLVAELISATSQRLVLATSSDTLRSNEFETHLAGFRETIETVDLGPLVQPANLAYQLKILSYISEMKEKYPSAKILILEGDKFVIPLGFFKTPHRRDITVLVMRAPILRARMNRSLISDSLKRFGMAVSRLRGARVRVLAPALRALPPYKYRGFPAVPDPVDLASTPESIQRYRTDVGLDQARVWVGVFGNISPRKNLDMIADSLSQLDAKTFGLLVAGKIDREELARCAESIKRLRNAGGEVLFDSRLLSDVELDSAIASVSVVAIAHSSEGPSGILGKAAASGIPVAAAGALSLKEDIERLRAGVWSALTVDAFAGALGKASTLEQSELEELANGRDFARALVPTDAGTM